MLIYKYALRREYGEQKVEMPYISVPISFGLDPQGELCVWCLVDTSQPKTHGGATDNPTLVHRFFVGLTGHEGPSLPLDVFRRQGTFLGTVIDGRYVLHGFYLGFEQPKA